MSLIGGTRGAVGVVAAGRYGITLAEQAARNGHDVVLLTTSARRAATLKRHRRLPSVVPELDRLHERVVVTSDARDIAARCTLVLVTASEEDFGQLIGVLGDALDGSHIVVHAIHRLFGPRLSRVTEEIRSRTAVKQVGVMAGPMHVSEVLGGKPNAAVVGSSFPAAIEAVRDAISAEHIRVEGSDDNRGVELAAALGQVVALAVGIADGLQLGAATHATLITRGLAEMTEVGVRLGALPGTFYGLAGVGRLVDALRRGEPNYQAGLDIGSAPDLQVALANLPTDALAFAVLKPLSDYADYFRVSLPISLTVKRILEGGCAPDEAIREALRQDLVSSVRGE
ncbi:MAG: glycerol-3-phosphate dehydrogenase (NAD(P)+) [Bradymonadia bacterium]|jgi:glycerol-3-phosphate dehydrogenase (NAD(P)+)